MEEGKGGVLTAVVGLVLGLVLLMTLVIVAVDEDEQDPCKPTGTSSSADGGVPDGEYSKPLKSSDYTESSGYRTPDRPDHRGTDMAAPMHTPIFAFADGVVVNAGPSNDGPQGFGNWVVIDHEGKDGDGKFSTVYGHMPLGDIVVKPGDKVKAGQHIAGVGSEGGSSGPHLHFEVWPGGRQGGKDVDPNPWVDKAKDPGAGGGGESSKDDKDAPKDEGDDKAKKAAQVQPKKDSGGSTDAGGVLVVGDSISEGSRSQLEAKIPGVKVNARVSRPFDEGANIIRRDIDSLPGTVVIALGTNGGVSASDYKALVEEVKGKGSKVVGVNTYADRDWTEATNAAIDGAGIPVADWHGAVEKDSSLLGGDGLHPSPAGQAKFAELVAGVASGGGGGGAKGSEQKADTRDLADLPSDKIASEEHLTKDSVRIARAVASKFPELETIGGWRPSDPYPDHPSGRAVDVMIPNYDSDKGKALGTEIKDYIFRNKDAFNVQYMIWRQEYIPADGEPNTMEDRGDPTQNHMDHVHVTVNEPGGGIYKKGDKLGSAPEGGGPGSGSASGSCGGSVGEHGRSLNDGEIPEELKKPIRLGGQVCKEVDSPLLAGLLYHESMGFQATAVSPVGAQGYGQFMPETWATQGAETDKETGEVKGPPGSGSPSDPMDAAMASARYLCLIAENQKPLIESGQIKGDPRSLMLAGYNSGEGNVQNYGGVPPFAETQKYVVIVPQEIEKFTATAGKE